MTTYQPNDDHGAQHIAYTTPDSGTLITWPVVGWGNPGEGWGHLTPVIDTPDGPQALPFDPDRRFAYGPTDDDAAWNLRQLTQAGTAHPRVNEPFTPSHQAPADIDPALLDFDDANADVIACLAAMHRGDHRGAAAVLASTNVARLAYPLLHLVAALGPAAVGAEAWAEALTAWQPGQSLGEGLAR